MTSHRDNLHWFKRHPQFLQSESRALSEDANYREIRQARGELFLSHGCVRVVSDEIREHPILIVYRESTPYTLPHVIVLSEELTVAEVDELAQMTISQVLEKVANRVKHYPKLRHQSRSGVLCILERSILDTGSEFVSITAILKRIRDWFAGHITGNFPPDSEEVEYTAHFPVVSSQYQILYPEEFLNTSMTQGFFYAQLLHNAGRSIYYGNLIDGLTPGDVLINGITTPTLRPLREDLRTSADFELNKGEVERLITEKQLLHGVWFQVKETIGPFVAFKELVEIIGGGDSANGVTRFIKTCKEFLNPLYDYFFIGIQYPNYRGETEFQVFRVIKRDTATPIISRDETEKMQGRLDCYDHVEAIWCQKFTDENFHQRNSTRARRDVLARFQAAILGVGSVGSEIADSLCKAGIGTLVLADNQEFEAHNAVRHVGSLSFMGIPKAIAMTELLRLHNPFVTIVPLQINLAERNELFFHLGENSISVSSIADDNVEGYINQEAMEAGKTVFYVRALRGGKMGRIFRVKPGQDACFNCIALHMNGNHPYLRIEEDDELTVLRTEWNNPIRPASAADLKLLASIAGRLLIDHVQEGESEFNHWIWSTQASEGNGIATPFALASYCLQPHSDCQYCRSQSTINVSVLQTTLDQMKNLVQEMRGIETGGVLAGVVQVNGDIVITAASGPGPLAVHERTLFRRDVTFCQSFLDSQYRTSGQKIVYVGEWHSHPDASNQPSQIDINTLSEISTQSNYLTVQPVMIIFSKDGVPSCTIHPANKEYYTTELVIHDEEPRD